MRLKDKVVIVTGSGNGMGRRIARRFGEEGAKVIVSDVDDEGGRGTVERIVSDGGTASYMHCSIMEESDIANLVQFAVNTYGRLDVLHANAADRAAWLGQNILDTTLEVYDNAMAAVPRANFILAKYAVPEMIRGGGGVITFISSIRGLNGAGSLMMYGVSKSALIVLAKCIAIEYGPQGIRCNCIAPGVVRSNLDDNDPFPDSPRDRYSAAAYPLGRLGKPKDIANAAVFLASDEASWISGHVLVVDGGITAQIQDEYSYRLHAHLKAHPDLVDAF
jgi:NAD(P)-dependent dehydrogenase (short-subunit alcohol dehydrogenase family)